MPYIGTNPTNRFSSVEYQDLTGVTGSPAKRGFTLNNPVGSANDIEVFVNNVRQEPSVAYTVDGTTTLTMTGDVETTDDFYVVFQAQAIGTATHPAGASLQAATGTFSGDVDINGNNLILDADADSKIEASTDDTINVVSGGNTGLTIDSTGRVFKPAIPFFVLLGGNAGDSNHDNGDTLGNTTQGHTAFATSGSIAGIRGFTYTSSTGVIGVPVDGLYHIGGNVFNNNTSQSMIIALYQGSSIISYVQQDLIGNVTLDLVANLSAGDQLTFRNVTGSTVTIYEGPAHTQVYGYLIG
tara:strand:- start:6340 stop:7230 length:891 start_codon:yes stop_codon:yes gene_type:complete